MEFLSEINRKNRNVWERMGRDGKGALWNVVTLQVSKRKPVAKSGRGATRAEVTLRLTGSYITTNLQLHYD